jgi:hypothetical protein
VTDFLEFWREYPRLVGKFRALQLWRKLSDRDQRLAVKGVQMWKLAYQWQDATFIPYASTFLFQRRWEDDPWPGAREEFGIADVDLFRASG